MARNKSEYAGSTEEELINACRENIRSAQFEFFKRYSGRLLGIALRFAGNEDGAHDLLQEAFIRIFTHMKEYRHQGAIEAWMRRIMIRTSIDYMKKFHRIRFESVDDRTENVIPAYYPADSGMNCDDILKEVSKLADGYRTILNLYAIEGYSYKEISEMLEIEETTVRSQYLRAKRKLGEALFKIEKTDYVTKIV